MASRWSKVYERAELPDGSLLFPERLTREFLDNARRVMGSYLYANQYLNEVIPLQEQVFRSSWKRYAEFDPVNEVHNNIVFVDPAIGESKSNDFTAIVVVSVTTKKLWYVRYAERHKKNPTEIISILFRINEQWKPVRIGIEDVAYQRALIHFANEESRRRGIALPIQSVKRGPDKTKQMRILGLVPRFEWGTLFLSGGLTDLETEMDMHPRGAHDDLLDALASIEDVVVYPQPIRKSNEAPSPNDPRYEQWYRSQIHRRPRIGEGPVS